MNHHHVCEFCGEPMELDDAYSTTCCNACHEDENDEDEEEVA